MINIKTISHGNNFRAFLDSVVFLEDSEFELEDLFEALKYGSPSEFFEINENITGTTSVLYIPTKQFLTIPANPKAKETFLGILENEYAGGDVHSNAMFRYVMNNHEND
jgi:hypothetical protein